MRVMDDSSYFFKVLAVFASAAALILGMWVYFQSHRTAGYAGGQSAIYSPQQQPQTSVHTLAFMPGQYLDIPNRRFRKIEIHSTFPVRVISGACQQNYGVEFYCDSDPADIFITDMRQRPIFSAPQGNTVTITAQEF